jgi:hypothetical protein
MSKTSVSQGLSLTDSMGKEPMMTTEHRSTLRPLGGWSTFPIRNSSSSSSSSSSSNSRAGSRRATHEGLGGSYYAVSTTFMPCGVAIEPSSTTELISLVSLGVLSIRVLFTRDATVASSTSSPLASNQQHATGGGDVVIQELAVPPPPGYVDDTGPRTVTFRTPFPCSRVEVMVLARSSEFVALLSLATLTSSLVRSSSMSTPQSKAGPGPRSLLA